MTNAVSLFIIKSKQGTENVKRGIVMEFDLSALLAVVFLNYLVKFAFIDLKLRRSIEYVYKKNKRQNEYIFHVMFVPYVFYIKFRKMVDAKLFWWNVAIISWLGLSLVFGIIHLYVMELWIAKAMLVCNTALLLVEAVVSLISSILYGLRGEAPPEYRKRSKRKSYITLLILFLSIVAAISVYFS